jgi:DUF4097 and DUF4098 domain-containing protein YvlB
VYNLAGRVTVERGSGSAVTVEVTRGGADASALRVEQRTIDGRHALCVVYPNDRIIYSARGRSGTSRTTTSREDCRGGARSGLLTRRQVEVASRGDGTEAWADLRIVVPAGRDVRVFHLVGNVEATGVEADLFIDVGSSHITTRDTRGTLAIDGGSGGTSITGHRGDVTIDVGSGGVRLDRITARTVSVDAGSGGIHGAGITTEELLIDTGSGSIDVTAVSARRIRMDTGSGNTRVALTTRPDDVEIDTGSGSVTLALPPDAGARVDVSTGSGGIGSDFELRDGRIRRNEMRGTIGDGRGHIQIDTGSGGVHLTRTR